jgi:hypothetical protein
LLFAFDGEATMNRTEYNRFEIGYLTDNIKFADSKAGVLIGVDGLLLRSAIDYFDSHGITIASLVESFSMRLFPVLGAAFLIAGIVLSLAVVFPRRGAGAKKGFIFWENIAQYPSAREYTKDLMNTGEEELDKNMAEQHYYVSMTATKKYTLLRRAFWASSLGALCIVVTGFGLK